MKFQNDGKVFLRVVNSNASSRSMVVRLTSLRDGVAPLTTERAYTHPGSGTGGGVKFYGPFPVAEYNQNDGGTEAGYVYVDGPGGGTKQVETATVAEDTPGTLVAGDATVIVTAAGMAGSPITVSVALATNDTVNQVATKIRAALAAHAVIGAFFTVSGSNAAVILTVVTTQANDGTLNISIADGTCDGLTTAASSANTTAGVASNDANLTYEAYRL